MLRTGHMLVAIGAALISQLPAEPWQLWAATAVWTWSVFRQNRKLRRAWARYRSIDVYPDGRVELVGTDGERRDARLEDGTVVLSRFGWLRLSTATDGYFAELVSGVAATPFHWRRLQVIRRHIGASR